MDTTFAMQRRVEFAETDMAGIAHFTSFFRYMEQAEHAFLRARGLSGVMEDAKGKLGFPKVSATCSYRRPARYEELLDVVAHIKCRDGKLITYDCLFTRDGETIAEGQLTVALCRFPIDQLPYPILIRDSLLQRLFGRGADRG